MQRLLVWVVFMAFCAYYITAQSGDRAGAAGSVNSTGLAGNQTGNSTANVTTAPDNLTSDSTVGGSPKSAKSSAFGKCEPFFSVSLENLSLVCRRSKGV